MTYKVYHIANGDEIIKTYWEDGVETRGTKDNPYDLFFAPEKKVLRQIEDYMDFVRKQPNFNSEYRRWKFIAVCKEVDEDVKGRYKTFEDKGKIGLVIQVENYEVYALTWDDVFKSFELRHAPLLKRLNYDREKLAKELMKEIENEEGRDKVNTLTNIAIGKIGDVS